MFASIKFKYWVPFGPLEPTVPPALNLIMKNLRQIMKLMFEKNSIENLFGLCWSTYRKVLSSRLPWLVAHQRIFRLFMKGNFDAYVLRPLDKMVQNWIVDRSTACNFTVDSLGKITLWWHDLSNKFFLWSVQYSAVLPSWFFFFQIMLTPRKIYTMYH